MDGGRRRFRGLLVGTKDDAVCIRQEDQAPGEPDVLLRIEDMIEARIVLTEAAIVESLKRGKAAEKGLRKDEHKSQPWRDARRNQAGTNRPDRFQPNGVKRPAAQHEGD